MNEPTPPIEFKKKIRLLADYCRHVPKLGVNKFHNYKYALASDVLEKVAEGMQRYGLISYPSFRVIKDERNQNKTGTMENLVMVLCKLHVEDVEASSDPKEAWQGLRTIEALGSGQDPSDKAVMKAQTAALKYAWMTFLNISTGDDPEMDETVDQRTYARLAPAPAPPPQHDLAPDLPAKDSPLFPEQKDKPPAKPKTREFKPHSDLSFTNDLCDCGAKIVSYTSNKSGDTITQCNKAYLGYFKDGNSEITKSHFFKIVKKAKEA